MMALYVDIEKMSSDEEPYHSSNARNHGHVMISYQWDAQEIALEVKQLLVSKGFRVWTDIDNMQNSILESMADAVERASVVLVFMSQKYKDSHSCRNEVAYTYTMNKPLIPILVEKGYRADGWLGAMVGMKLYYDFSSGERLANNFPKLLEELSTIHKDDCATEANKKLTSLSETSIDRSLNLIERALENQYSVVEEIRALTLSAGDNEKSKDLVRKGILKSLLKMMNGKDEEIKLAATTAVGALAFANAHDIETFEGGKMMELLRNFSAPKLTDLQKTAKEALLFIEPGTETQAKPSVSGHVMISYQWDSQATMIKVRDELESKGYKVWMDIIKMSGSLLDSMAKAVQEAYVVLVAVSEKYKNSYNCGKEGKYVSKKRKPVIPILVEANYEADDWLGILIGDEMHFDLSSEEKFNKNFPNLLDKLSAFTKAC